MDTLDIVTGLVLIELGVVLFGFEPQAILKLWPWVGGRYSVWSSVGMPIALCYGMAAFQALQEGAHKMDQHLMMAPTPQNLPMMAVWF